MLWYITVQHRGIKSKVLRAGAERDVTRLLRALFQQ